MTRGNCSDKLKKMEILKQIKEIILFIFETLNDLLEPILFYWDLYLGWLPYHRLIFYLLFLLIIFIPLFLLFRRKPKKSRVTRLTTGKEIRKEAKLSEKSGEFLRAGELYEQIERYKKAIDMYLRAGAVERASRIYLEKFNNFEKALKVFLDNEKYDLAGELCAQEGKHQLAGEYLEKAGKIYESAQNYEKAGDFARSAILYEKAGFLEESAICYGKIGQFAKAGQLMEQVWKSQLEHFKSKGSAELKKKLENLAKRTAYFYKQAGDLKKSAQVLEQAGMFKYAGELYLLAGDLEKAGEMFYQSGEHLKSADLLEQAGQKQKADEIRAQYHQNQGDLLKSAQHYERAGDYLTAADLYAGLGEMKKAGELYLKGGDSRTAAETFYACGELARAGEAYENLGNYEMAIQIYQELGELKKLSQLYEKLEDFYNSALCYFQLGAKEKALTLLKQISPQDPNYLSALELSGDILFEQGKHSEALNQYRLVASKRPMNLENLELYLKIARLYEKAGSFQYAFDLYQRLYYLSPDHPELVKKIRELKMKMRK